MSHSLSKRTREFKVMKYEVSPREADSIQEMPFKRLNASLGDALPMGIQITDSAGQCVYSNPAFQKLSGWTVEELEGSYWISMIHPQDHTRVTKRWQDSLASGTPFQCEARLKRADGKDVWTHRHIAAMDADDRLPGCFYVHTVENISVQKARDALLAMVEERVINDNLRTRVMLDCIGDGLICIDTDGRITYLNGVAEKLTGFSREEAVGEPLAAVYWVLDAESGESRADPAWRAMVSNSVGPLHSDSAVLVTRSGLELAIEDSATPIHNRKQEVAGAVIRFHDTRYSAETTAKMTHLALYDSLTGLLNRFGLSERFNQSLALAKRNAKPMAVLFIDLENFKNVNDIMGHASGDELLCGLACKLVSSVRASDSVCRHSGDKFVVLLNEIAHVNHASAVAGKVHEALASTPMVVNGKAVTLRASIGVSVYPDNGDTLDALIRHADAARYQAKTFHHEHSKTKETSYISEGQQSQA